MSVEKAEANLAKRQENQRHLFQELDNARGVAVDALTEWFSTWPIEEARGHVRLNPATAEALGRNEIQAIRTAVTKLAERAEALVAERLGDSSEVFPHLVGRWPAVYSWTWDHNGGKTILALEGLVGEVLFEHGLVKPQYGDYFSAGDQAGYHKEGSVVLRQKAPDLGLSREAAASMGHYQSLIRKWEHVHAEITKAEQELSQAKATDLWD